MEIMPPVQELEKIKGQIEKIIFKNEDNGYHILSVSQAGILDLDSLIVTATRPKIVEGITLEFHGNWTIHPKYGRQFASTLAYEIPPSTKEGLISYLSSSFFHGIGPVKARSIVNHFGDNTLDIFNNSMDRLIEVSGISKKTVTAIKAGWEQNKEINEIMQFLMEHQINAALAGKIYEHYGKDCVSQIKENPYDLSRHIRGIGFKRADKIALSLGIKENDPLRVEACVYYVLERSEENGHCFLYQAQIYELSEEYLGFSMKEYINNALKSLETSKQIKAIQLNDEMRYYSNRLFYNENYCYQRLTKLGTDKNNFEINEDALREHIKSTQNIELSEEQFKAVIGILKNKVSVLTGGPGVGKCLKKGTLVLMYDGSKKKVEDIKVDDLLMGDDSLPRNVKSLARGREQMYDIISNDGKEWGCNESHILSLKYNDKRPLKINGMIYQHGEIVDISVKDYLKFSERTKHHLKQYSTEVEYNSSNQLPLDAYLLGIWLGDGSSYNKTFTITNEDKEIEEYCKKYAIQNGFKYVLKKPENRTQFIKLLNHKNKTSLYSILKQLNVFNNKSIPNIYSLSTRKERLNLLAGLIDSDGYLHTNNLFEITLKNQLLAQQTHDLAMSLGFRSKIKSKSASMKRVNGTKYECDVYRVTISGNIQIIPTKISRKKPSLVNPNKNHLVSGFRVVKKSVDDYYGFEIDGNKRFVLGNYVVTHNTSTTKALVEALEFFGYSFLLCAPTGRAAKRMSEVIGQGAKTIHRLLSWDPLTSGFAFNERNPMVGDFLIVDETSMLDIHLSAALLKAVPDNMSIVFIGDKDQLPPVGPGNFFSDLIESGRINTFKLTKIFRQATGSNIVLYSHDINNGKVPNIESPLLTPELWTNKADCMFIDSGFKESSIEKKDHPKWSSLRYGYDVVEMIEEVYKNKIPKYHAHPDDIQVLVPLKKGPIGSIEINKRLQTALNPKRNGLHEVKVIDKIFRENDKVIQLVNNYNLDVFNGDVGRIVAIDHSNGTVHIKYDENRIITYSRNDMLDIDLAYVITCHKAQGSEFEYVILPIMPQYYRMLYRKLLYTALTRAKKLAVFIGQRKSLTMAVENKIEVKRQSSLLDWLSGDKAFDVL